MSRTLNKIIFLAALLPIAAWALSTDAQLPIHIVGDSSFFNYKTGTSIYEKNVVIDQGTTHLVANRVTTKNNAEHKIDEVIAEGTSSQLAELSTIPKKGDEIFHARAQTIKFFPQTKLVVLEGSVSVTQGKNSFQGQHIIYNMKDQTVIAPASKGGRATIVIDPDKLKS